MGLIEQCRDFVYPDFAALFVLQQAGVARLAVKLLWGFRNRENGWLVISLVSFRLYLFF